MKRRFAYTLGAVALLLLTTTAALAIDAPHDYKCTVCHVMHRTLGLNNTVNICLACHASASATTHNFKPLDQANPFGTVSLDAYTSSSKGKQSSHNWNAPDTLPAAGSTAPTDLKMNSPASIKGTVTCARCHSIHVGFAEYTGTNPKRSKPLLRMRNDTDQMCLDCHKTRNQTTASQGTHPVNVNYDDVAAAKPDEYNATPVNTNPDNSTSAMKLNNGVVLCSTCHGPHFTDSNARTFDSNSSMVLGQISSSKGLLLRTDLKRDTVTDINICVNCHKSTDNTANTKAKVKNHNGSKNQNVQCADCHGGHVDYDPDDPSGSLGKNVWLVNRYMNISTQYGAVRNKRVLFQYTSSTQKNYNKDATGVCLACHSPLPSGVAQHSSTDATVCNSCHKHSLGFSANCTMCHGFPPTTADPPTGTSGSTGYAVDSTKGYDYSKTTVYKDESLTPHGSHAAGGGTNYSYDCTECHNGNNHDNGDFQQVFPVASAALVSNGKGAVAAPSYDKPAPGTCTTYCHSNGAPRGQTYVTTAPTWEKQKGTIIGKTNECVACHGGVITGYNNLSTNAHFRHVSDNTATGKGYTCNVCHAATVSSNSAISTQANHVNAIKDISFSGTLASGSTMDTTATCTTYCHSNGGVNTTTGVAMVNSAPAWTTPASGQCGSCHKVSLAIAGQGTLIDTNAHFAHMSSTYGPKLYIEPTTAAGSCAKCHTYTGELDSTHVNATIEVPGTNCAPCHNNGITISGGWNGGRVTCESCHTGTLSVVGGLTAPDKPEFTTTGHGQSGANYDASRKCSNCHDPNSPHISSAIGTYKRIAVNDNTLCSGCHNDAAKVPTVAKQNVPTHVVDKTSAEEAGPTMDCKACHDAHGTGYTKMVRTQVVFNGSYSSVSGLNYNGTVFVQTSAPYRGLCQGCHTKTNHYRRNVAETGHPTKGCLGCHMHKAAYAFKPQACDSCHGYPPADRNASFGTHGNYSSARFEDYSSGGGAHTKAGHIKPAAVASEGFANCVACHGNGSPANTHNVMPPYTPVQSNVNVDADDHYKFNSGLPLDKAQYSGTLSNNTTGSCSNVSCHFKPTPIWGPK